VNVIDAVGEIVEDGTGVELGAGVKLGTGVFVGNGLAVAVLLGVGVLVEGWSPSPGCAMEREVRKVSTTPCR
jgi:hypothetical protein